MLKMQEGAVYQTALGRLPMTEPQQHTIDRFDIRPGWVIFKAGKSAPPPDLLPLMLSQTIGTWLRQTPHLVVKSTLPIVAQGATVEIHVWFDE